MNKSVSKAVTAATSAYTKFTKVTVARGKTAFPKDTPTQERLGIRWDFDGEVTKADGTYNKFQMQANAGKVPSSIKTWRENNGGTHAVMASVFVKKDGTKEDVKKGLEEGGKAVKSNADKPKAGGESSDKGKDDKGKPDQAKSDKGKSEQVKSGKGKKK